MQQTAVKAVPDSLILEWGVASMYYVLPWVPQFEVERKEGREGEGEGGREGEGEGGREGLYLSLG